MEVTGVDGSRSRCKCGTNGLDMLSLSFAGKLYSPNPGDPDPDPDDDPDGVLDPDPEATPTPLTLDCTILDSLSLIGTSLPFPPAVAVGARIDLDRPCCPFCGASGLNSGTGDAGGLTNVVGGSVDVSGGLICIGLVVTAIPPNKLASASLSPTPEPEILSGAVEEEEEIRVAPPVNATSFALGLVFCEYVIPILTPVSSLMSMSGFGLVGG